MGSLQGSIWAEASDHRWCRLESNPIPEAIKAQSSYSFKIGFLRGDRDLWAMNWHSRDFLPRTSVCLKMCSGNLPWDLRGCQMRGWKPTVTKSVLWSPGHRWLGRAGTQDPDFQSEVLGLDPRAFSGWKLRQAQEGGAASMCLRHKFLADHFSQASPALLILCPQTLGTNLRVGNPNAQGRVCLPPWGSVALG